MLDFEEELLKLTMINTEEQEFLSSTSLLSQACNAMESTVSRFDRKQKEMFIHLEEITDAIDELSSERLLEDIKQLEADESSLVRGNIQNADLVEDFYLFALESGKEALIRQAVMMWDMQCKNLNACGIARIHDENTAFTSFLNTVAGIGFSPDIPQGFVMKTLRSGYMYKNKLIRKSSVIVNNESEAKKNE